MPSNTPTAAAVAAAVAAAAVPQITEGMPPIPIAHEKRLAGRKTNKMDFPNVVRDCSNRCPLYKWRCGTGSILFKHFI